MSHDKNETNGSSTLSLKDLMQPDWHIVRDAGLWLLGVPKDGHLAPVFEYTVQLQQRQGGVTIHDGAQPLFLMASMTERWKLSTDARLWPVRGCSREKTIRAAIEQAGETVRQLRAQDAGIAIVKEMPKPARRIQ